jgi:hypothetical protein
MLPFWQALFGKRLKINMRDTEFFRVEELFGEKAGKDAQGKEGSGQPPGKLFNKIYRSGSPKHLIRTLTSKSTVNTSSFRILYQDDSHQEYTYQSNENG